MTPLVVLVHGAWHGAWCWAALAAELDRRGIPSLAPDLPGHGASTLPAADLHTDADHVVGVLRAVHAERPRPVVLVGHSYGGAVVTDAAGTLAAAGDPAAPVALCYLAAFVPDAGESVLDQLTSMPPAPTALAGAMVRTGDGASEIDTDVAAAVFYGHCPSGAAAAATARLGRQPDATFAQPVRTAGWRHLPATYVACGGDEAVAPAHQELMAERCATRLRFDTDHSPFLSMPVETADVIERICASTRGVAA